MVLTVSKVAGPCAESGGYEWDSKDGDDHRGWEDAMGSGGMSSREQGGQSGGSKDFIMPYFLSLVFQWYNCMHYTAQSLY